MQYVSNTFKEILQGNYSVDTKVIIDGETFEDDRIYSIRINRQVFKNNYPSVGGCVSAEIDLEVITPVIAFSKAASIEPYCRVRNSQKVSEWIPKGKFYIDTREKNVDKGTIRLHGYDSILLLDKQYITTDRSSGWNMVDWQVLNDIGSIAGIVYDGEFNFNKGYNIPYPGHKDGSPTMREMLEYIGAMYGGNWVVKDNGQFHFLQLNSLPEETFFLIDENGFNIQFGGDTINV